MPTHWLDLPSFVIVVGGTFVATLLRCGPRDTRDALRALVALVQKPFDMANAKSELAKQIREIADDGFVRAEAHHFGDGEFDYLADVLISQRSIDALHAEHLKYKIRRMQTASLASQVFDQAAELAPVLGLAGTLIALGSGAAGGQAGDGLIDTIAMAVVTTLYGLVCAHFLFAPLSAAIMRRATQEEVDRQTVLDWLAHGIDKVSSPAAPAEAAPRMREAS